MINPCSTIKIGYEVEYVFDMINKAPFIMTEKFVRNAIRVVTDTEDIIITDDTLIMNDRGLYVLGSDLKVGQALHNVMNTHAVVKDIRPINHISLMLSVHETDYVVVNGFYISADM